MRALTICFAFFMALPLLAAGGENLSAEALLPGHEQTDAHAPVAVFGKDIYLIVWEAGRDDKADLVALRLDKSGKALDAKPFVISGAKDCQERPRVVFGGGVFLVVWHDLRNGKDWDVYAARVTPEGKVLDPDGIAVSTEKLNQAQPAVCFDGKNFQILWRDTRGGAAYEIYGGRVGADGRTFDGSGVLVQTSFKWSAYAYAGSPAVGVAGGQTIAVARGIPPYGGAQVWPMQDGKQSGKPQKSTAVRPGEPGSGTVGSETYTWNPAFASDGQKLLMVFTTFQPVSRAGVWPGSGAVLLAPDLKNLPAATITVSSPKDAAIRNPAPAWDGNSYVVAWDIPIVREWHQVPRSYDVVFLRRISREGAPQGENIPVAGELDSPAFHPAAASDGAGTTIIAYERHPKIADTPIKIGVRILTK